MKLASLLLVELTTEIIPNLIIHFPTIIQIVYESNIKQIILEFTILRLRTRLFSFRQAFSTRPMFKSFNNFFFKY